MHRQIIIFTLLVVYYTLTTFGLYIFDAGLLTTSVFLYGIPAILLAHFTLAPTAVILSVTAMGIGLAVLLEGIAHTFGLWYSLGENEVRLLTVLPLEMLSALTLQIVFLSLVYEVLFDDGNYTLKSAQDRLPLFSVFAIAATVLIGLHQFVLNGVFVEYSYIWIIGSLLAASLTMLLLHKELSVAFFDKIIDFALICMVPLGIGLWLAIENVHKVFANTNEYIGTVNFFGNTAPVEEILLLFVLPLFIAIVYELYLDDAA